jgi:hypothetical protein
MSQPDDSGADNRDIVVQRAYSFRARQKFRFVIASKGG